MTKKNRALMAFILDLVLVTLSFFLAIYLKRGKFVLNKDYQYLLFAFYSIWIISTILSKKYNFTRPRNLREGLNPFFRSFFYMCILLFFIIFLFKLFSYSRFIILVTLIIYFSIIVLAYIAFYIYKWGPNVNIMNGDDNPLGFELYSNYQNEEAYIDTKERHVRESLKTKLKETYLLRNQSPIFTDYFSLKLYNFLDSAINLDAISASDSIMFYAKNADNVNSILNDRLEYIGNLRDINDIQGINELLIAVNQKLIQGGYFLGIAETLEQRLERKFSAFPKLFRKFLYLLDFIWTRVFPKLFILKNIYFIIHRKGKKIISKSEVLGRLYFAGFKIIEMKEIDKKLCFVVKKVRPPLDDKSSSYGPVFKQRRIGLNGEIIYTYKFRTMYPYSEYIQTYVQKKSEINKRGKISQDFRITSWGHFLRKHYIDELPMLINLIRGDIKLVGVRPLSKAHYIINPEDLKKARLKFKPGLLPPCYADLPNSKEEFWESERKYLNSYEKHPWITDFIYFLKIMKNILFRKARSE